MIRVRFSVLQAVMLMAISATSFDGNTCYSQQSRAFPTVLDARSITNWNEIRLTGSDQRSIQFNQGVLPSTREVVERILISGKAFGDRNSYRLDQDKLFLTSPEPYPVRVYFLAEGAGYRNSVGLSLNLAGATTRGDLRMIFPDASMPVAGNDYRTLKFGQRRSDAPLLPGDFVDIGLLTAGTQLDFFLIQNGALGGQRYVFSNSDLTNVDKTQHVIAFILPNSPFLLIGFEDLLNGGDKDYEDVLIVVDIGYRNAIGLFDPSQLPN